MSKELLEEDLTRDEAAERLETLAGELRGEGAFDVAIGNRTVHLSPPANIGMETGIREKSSRLRGDRESVTVTIDWKPD